MPTAIRQRSCRIGSADWSFGQTRFNILMLGVVHDGVAYLLIWTMPDKKGNSNSNERMNLLDRFEQIFPDTEVAYTSGDKPSAWLRYANF